MSLGHQPRHPSHFPQCQETVLHGPGFCLDLLDISIKIFKEAENRRSVFYGRTVALGPLWNVLLWGKVFLWGIQVFLCS